MKKTLQKSILSFSLLVFTHAAFTQSADSAKMVSHISGNLSLTNNGISVIPTFTLGKPAAIFSLSMGKNRFSFDPDLRFSLSGKPWGFIFWARYQVLNKGKFRMSTGTHLGIAYSSTPLPANGDSKEEVTVAKRYLAGELSPGYSLSKYISIGMYYMYAHGIDPGTTKNTHFVTINSSFSNIKLSNKVSLAFNPQVYYLKMDANDGCYLTAGVTVSKKQVPVSMTVFINKTIQTNIPGSSDFLWNTTLTYSFHRKYRQL
ncbi:MAG TPA: hypothetical protein PKM63_14120 [Panacibacter sp.]|nr:hypothetical protein [Panacibacter sp.]HNP45422.1 hypothetical protein [Panacibacter sp.]